MIKYKNIVSVIEQELRDTYFNFTSLKNLKEIISKQGLLIGSEQESKGVSTFYTYGHKTFFKYMLFVVNERKKDISIVINADSDNSQINLICVSNIELSPVFYQNINELSERKISRELNQSVRYLKLERSIKRMVFKINESLTNNINMLFFDNIFSLEDCYKKNIVKYVLNSCKKYLVYMHSNMRDYKDISEKNKRVMAERIVRDSFLRGLFFNFYNNFSEDSFRIKSTKVFTKQIELKEFFISRFVAMELMQRVKFTEEEMNEFFTTYLEENFKKILIAVLIEMKEDTSQIFRNRAIKSLFYEEKEFQKEKYEKAFDCFVEMVKLENFQFKSGVI